MNTTKFGEADSMEDMNLPADGIWKTLGVEMDHDQPQQ